MSRSAAEPARVVYDSIPSAVLVLGRGGHILHANRAAEALFGLEAAKMRARRPEDLWEITADDGSALGPSDGLGARAIASGMPEPGVLRRVLTSDGRRLSLHVEAIPSLGADGRAYQAVCTLTDLTAQRRGEAAIRQEEREWRQVFQKAGNGMARLSLDGRIVRANEALHQLLGYAPPRLHGRRLAELVHPDDAAGLSLPMLSEFDLGRSEAEVRYLRVDGSPVWVRSVLTLVRDGDDEAFVVNTIDDITARKAREAELESRAVRDPVTGLPNRTVLQDRLVQAIRAAERDGSRFTLLLIDLDGFKRVNDSFGHQAGDRILVEAAGRLRAAVRESDTVTRVGGDEFAIVLDGADSADAAATAARKVAEALNAPFNLDGNEFGVGASVGAAQYPDHGADAETLYRAADAAMYTAKRSGSGLAIFSSDDGGPGTRLALIAQLRGAIAAGQLLLHFQPQVELSSGVVRGVEALVRWRHPEHGLLLPDRFLAAAEEAGLIADLEHWVLDEALRTCRGWRDLGLELWVSVNISGTSLLDRALPGRISALLDQHRLDPTSLQVEIVQNALGAGVETVAAAIDRLVAIGLRVSLDDFGIGHASLEQARRLQVDELKIHRSFVLQLARTPQDAAIVDSIAALGRSLGMRVVALGVEDEQTAELLQTAGVELAQGFYVGRPCAADEVPALIEGAQLLPLKHARGLRRPAISFDEINRRLRVLEPVSLFMSLSSDQLRRLARQMTAAVLPEGEAVVAPGAAATELHVIEEGLCEVMVVDDAGQERPIARLGRGDVVGSSLIVGEPSTARVRALSECRLLRIDAQVLLSVLGDDSKVQEELRQVAQQRKALVAERTAATLHRANSTGPTVISVYSPKGGAGKTTVAVNLAAALAKRWPQDVLLIDVALPYNHAALVTRLAATTCLARLAGAEPADLDMLLRGAIVRHPGQFMVLSTALRPEEADLITPELLMKALAFAAARYRYVVFDLGVALSDPVLAMLEVSDHVAALVTPELTSMKDTRQFLDVLGNVLRVPSANTHVLVNHRSSQSGMTTADIEQVLDREVTAEIGYDGVRPERAALKGELLVLTEQRSGIGRAVDELARRIEAQRPAEKPAPRPVSDAAPGWFGYALG